MITRYAESQYISCYRHGQLELRSTFALISARTKYEIARAIVAEISAFCHCLLRYRKAWMSEDARQNLFDAAALAFGYFAERRI